MTPLEALKRYFGYDSFRPGQAEIVDAILAGRDALAIMPTGAGKSICYQLPALLLPGITLVISPLISLMQDQVKALNAAGIRAAYINSSLSESQISRALNLAAAAERELRRVTRHKQFLSESILSSAVSSSYYSNEKVLRTLDFEFTPVQETLRRVTRAYLEEKKR